MQRRENESITAFTMRRLTCEIVCAELQELAREFDGDPTYRWTGSEVADYLRGRAEAHPDFTDAEGCSNSPALRKGEL